MNKVWSDSKIEEIISALWFIVAFVGKPYISKTIYILVIVIAILSLVMSIVSAFVDRVYKK